MTVQQRRAVAIFVVFIIVAILLTACHGVDATPDHPGCIKTSPHHYVCVTVIPAPTEAN